MASENESIVDVSGACFDYVNVYSDGLWNVNHGESILQFAFFRFQVQLVAMVTISYFFHVILRRFHFPRLTSDVLTGILLGPTIFIRYFPYASKLLFPPYPNQVLASLLKIGLVLFTFLTAVRLDTGWLKRIGKRGYLLGVFVFAFPFTLLQTIDITFEPKASLSTPMIISRQQNTQLYLDAFTRSQFVDVSVVLMQLRITNSKLGHLALAITLIGDLAVFALSNFSYIMQRATQTSRRVAIQSFFLLGFFLLFIFVVMRGLSYWFIRLTPEGKPMKDLYVNIFVSTVLIVSSLGDNMGVDYLFGPFVLGLIVPAGSPLATHLTRKLDTVVYGLLVPLLSVHCGSKINLWALFGHMDLVLNFQISLIGYFFKLVATFLMVYFAEFPLTEAVALSLILNIKGTKEMGTFLSYVPIESKDLDSTAGIFLIFLLTSYAPPFIKWLYDPSKRYIGYKQKCIQYSPYDSPFEILVCAHKQEDAMAAVKLLQHSNPTKQSPFQVYGLCLEQLVSSANPLVINHQLGQKTFSSKESQSQPIIQVFHWVKAEYRKSVYVSAFTAISPIKQMHEDICWLAFDKSCSLILLPFHKKWNSNGNVVSNSKDIRNLNVNVFDKAPCSVGILVDHRRTRGFSSLFEPAQQYHVAMLFIGGADDRESLAYALRMARAPEVRVSVFCFRAFEERSHDSWEYMLDNESLRNLSQEITVNANICYAEERVRDGSDTSEKILNLMRENYDLIMVGRRSQEIKPEILEGLSEWAEYPELGPLGDLLASSDDANAASVLVIQQQIIRAEHSDILN